jgi:hypothetical protein
MYPDGRVVLTTFDGPDRIDTVADAGAPAGKRDPEGSGNAPAASI